MGQVRRGLGHPGRLLSQKLRALLRCRDAEMGGSNVIRPLALTQCALIYFQVDLCYVNQQSMAVNESSSSAPGSAAGSRRRGPFGNALAAV